MDRTFYLFVLMVLAERGARAENKEHGSITDRGVALDERFTSYLLTYLLFL